MRANEKQKQLISFKSHEEFFKGAQRLSAQSAVFIDSNLGNGLRGEDVAKKIYELGFKKIFLCTGYEKNSFPTLPWISDVVGKAPIWD